MRTERIFLIGAGGHGKVVLDALLAGGIERGRIVVTDSNPELAGRELFGGSIVVPAIQAAAAPGSFHVAIGSALARQRLTEELEALGCVPLTVVHPTAVVSPFAGLAAGVFIGAQAVIGPGASIGRGVIINHGAVVDHDCIVEQYTHVAPNATLGGATRVGAHVLIGAGATVLPGRTVGDRAVVGAGAVVVRDIAPGTTCVGVPAKSIRGD